MALEVQVVPTAKYCILDVACSRDRSSTGGKKNKPPSIGKKNKKDETYTVIPTKTAAVSKKKEEDATTLKSGTASTNGNAKIKEDKNGSSPIEKELSGILRTQKLYYYDTYLFEFRGSKLLAIIQGDSISAGKDNKDVNNSTTKIAFVFDKTIFHPQGGGQPSDVGIIRTVDGSRSWNVCALKEMPGGIVLHYVVVSQNEAPPAMTSLPQIGDCLDLIVDSTARLRHARLHSAGHCLDVAIQRCGYDLQPTKGYHFPDAPSVEYTGEIDDKELFMIKVNEEMQRLIEADIATTFSIKAASDVYDGSSSVQSVPLTRIVNVGGGDCPCAGTHVCSTAELMGLKVTRVKAKKSTVKVSYTMEE